MMTLTIIMVVLILILAITAFSLGIYMGQLFGRKTPIAFEKKNEPTKEEMRKTKRFNTEVSNMLSYDGTEQPDIADV